MGVIRDPEQEETRALRELVDLRGKDVLEVGCGDGRLTWRYADLARSVLGVDPDADAVAAARANLPERLCERVTFAAEDVASVGVPPAAYDVVLLAWSL